MGGNNCEEDRYYYLWTLSELWWRGFSVYPLEEEVEVVGYSYCGGCPGGNIEYVPDEMIKRHGR